MSRDHTTVVILNRKLILILETLAESRQPNLAVDGIGTTEAKTDGELFGIGDFQFGLVALGKIGRIIFPIRHPYDD